MANRAEQDGIRVDDGITGLGRQRVACGGDAGSADGVFRRVDGAVEELAGRAKHAHGFFRDLGPDPVARKDRHGEPVHETLRRRS
jgi:hypothetical protein